MKKMMFLMTLILLIGLSVTAQDKKTKPNNKFFISIAAGPAIPVSDFASKNFNNESAGLAKIGFTTNLQFGYQLHKYFGITSTILYSNYKVDVTQFAQYGVEADHWQHYGIMAGPMFTWPINEKVRTDFKVLGGIINVNSPLVKFTDGPNLMNEEWANSFAMQLGADLRYNFTPNLYLVTNVDYNFMKPKFDGGIYVGDGTPTSAFEQKISAINASIGLGVKF